MTVVDLCVQKLQVNDKATQRNVSFWSAVLQNLTWAAISNIIFMLHPQNKLIFINTEDKICSIWVHFKSTNTI